MFQFPGFALKTLCIQVISTWICLLLIFPLRARPWRVSPASWLGPPRTGAQNRSNNNKHSSGLPHSEIHGSKPVLGSPWLIAEYHVLHRLLLPRHPPNALIALDLIRKEQGSIRSKAYFPTPPWFKAVFWLVYLTWTKLPLGISWIQRASKTQKRYPLLLETLQAPWTSHTRGARQF
jgi:hypothetical protein